MEDPKSITEEESKKIFTNMLEEMTDLLNKRLGKEQYACYINLVWEKAITGKPNSYHSIHALSHPEDEDKVKNTIENLSKSLYEDPFVAGSVLHHTVSNFLDNNYDTSMSDIEKNFKVTGGEGPKDIN